MQNKWIIQVCLGLSIILCGCSVPFMGDKTAKAPAIETIKRTPVEKIIITELDIVDRPYVLLGDVKATEKSLIPLKSPNKEAAILKLKEAAAALDADAIIFVTVSSPETSWTQMGSIEARGKAIRFTRY